jgi:hypothetical protein
MTDHRAPSRLAQPRLKTGHTLPSDSARRQTAPQWQTALPEESYESEYDDSFEEQPQESTYTPPPLEEIRTNRGPAPKQTTSVLPPASILAPEPEPEPEPVQTYPEPAIYREPAYSSEPRVDRSAAPGELPKQVLHQMLFETIRLYNEEWQLARIVASAERKWLVAYLTPRNKRIDLKTALNKQKAMKITIDSKGNTAIEEPKRRKFLGLF